MKKMSVAIVLILTGFLYQNFAFKGLAPKNIKEVDEKARLEHARELLGKYYRRSSVASTEGLQHVNIHIYNQVHARLPKKFKKKSGKIVKAIISESKKHDFDPVFVMAVIRTESSFNPLAKGSVGELGLMQLRPETAEWIAQKAGLRWKGPKTLKDPVQNIRIGVAYLAFLRDYFDSAAYKYLSAYNVGPTKLKKLFEAETRPKEYSTKVMKHYEEFYGEMTVFVNLTDIASNGF